MKTSALYTKGQRFEPHRRRFFTPTVVLLSFNKPETVLWTIAKYYYYYKSQKLIKSAFPDHFEISKKSGKLTIISNLFI